MDDRIDVAKRKPRRLRGTPALSFINRTALIVLGVGVAIGLVTTLPFNVIEHCKEKYDFDILNVSEKEQARRSAFTRNFAPQRSGEEILEILKKQEKLQQEQANES